MHVQVFSHGGGGCCSPTASEWFYRISLATTVVVLCRIVKQDDTGVWCNAIKFTNRDALLLQNWHFAIHTHPEYCNKKIIRWVSTYSSPIDCWTLHRCRRCCQKERKGAIPVPGPTMITGTWKSCGRWNDGALVKEDTRFNVFFQTTLTSNKCDCITFMKENSALYGDRVGGHHQGVTRGGGTWLTCARNRWSAAPYWACLATWSTLHGVWYQLSARNSNTVAGQHNIKITHTSIDCSIPTKVKPSALTTPSFTLANAIIR